MINLDDIKGHSALSLLENYSGINPYLKKMRNDYLKNKKIQLTETQVKYIIDNHQREPMLINRIVNISKFLGEELQRQEELSFIPEKVLIEYILAENEKSYHIYGKIKKNQVDSKMYWLPKTQVIDDPYFEELDVNVDFEKYNKILAKSGKKLYEHQEVGIKFLLSRNGSILADDMGLGKFLTNNTLIYNELGTKKMGDIMVGDRVIGSDGKPCNVIGVFPQGKKETYKITFNDGYTIISGDEHLWSVSSSNYGKNRKNDRIKKSLVLSTKQMFEGGKIIVKGNGYNKDKEYEIETYYKSPNGNNKWQIPLVKPIKFENKDELPIDPYLLGLGLGDGSFKGKNINFSLHKDDYDELFNGFNLKENKPQDNKRIGYINVGNSLFNLNIEHTRSHNKFIPDIYKYSSIENRLAILQGLMDTDGHCMLSKNGNFTGTEYSTISEKLCDDVAEIVHTLGGICRKKSRRSFYKKDGIRVECSISYRLNIKLPSGMNPFRLKRKADRYNEPKKYPTGRYISKIEKYGEDECTCISVDSLDKLYVTEHAIVTHNTTQSIIAALESGAENILIVCPSAVKINWKREINVFCDDVTIVEGRKWSKAKFTIINYDILKNFHTLGDGKKKKITDPTLEYNRHLVNSHFDLVIIDEAHYLKNNKSIRGEIMVDLIVNNNIERAWLLTGTPVANRPMDFFNLLKIIKAPIANNWQYFATRYCDARKFFRTLKNGQRKQIWLTDGASNIDELAAKTKNLILRRLKNDVLDMPDKVITPFYHDLTGKGWDEYNRLWDDYLEKRKTEKKTGTIQRDLVELILLRKFIALEAIPQTIEMVENMLDLDKKVIIFTSFTDELDELAEYFGKKCVTHNGPMNAKEKQKSVDQFQNNNNIKVFIGNIKSAGVGITLTEANVVIFNSFDWVPGSNEQAEDRAYRIGQKNDVNIYYQLFEDTISTRMWDVLREKKDIISTIIGDRKLSEEEIIEIMTENLINEDNG